jgi:hypothetical protein
MKRPDLLSGLSFFTSRFNLLIANHPGRSLWAHFDCPQRWQGKPAGLPKSHHPQAQRCGGTMRIRTQEHRSACVGGSLGGAATPPYLDGGGVKMRPKFIAPGRLQTRHDRDETYAR